MEPGDVESERVVGIAGADSLMTRLAMAWAEHRGA